MVRQYIDTNNTLAPTTNAFDLLMRKNCELDNPVN